MAGSAVMAGCAPIVVLRQYGNPAHGNWDLWLFLAHPFHHGFLQRKIVHGRQKLAVGQLLPALRLSADTDELLYVAVPGRDICVRHRPVNAIAVRGIGAEILFAPSIDLPAPQQGAATHHIGTHPVERLVLVSDIGVQPIIVPVVDGRLTEGVGLLLNGIVAIVALAIGHAIEGQLPVLGVLAHVIDAVAYIPAPLQHQHFQAFLRQLFRCPAA